MVSLGVFLWWVLIVDLVDLVDSGFRGFVVGDLPVGFMWISCTI